MLEFTDKLVARVLGGLKWLALPVALLLFLQWPLREMVKAYSREANDLGQWLFALYVAGSVVAATRARMHLATDAIAKSLRVTTRARLALLGIVGALIPWVLFVFWSGAPIIKSSVLSLERFSDTGNPGYFMVKLALALLVVLVLLQGLVDLGRGRRKP